MRSWLVNKNVSLYYKLKHRIGKKRACYICKFIEKCILIFGREVVSV